MPVFQFHSFQSLSVPESHVKNHFWIIFEVSENFFKEFVAESWTFFLLPILLSIFRHQYQPHHRWRRTCYRYLLTNHRQIFSTVLCLLLLTNFPHDFFRSKVKQGCSLSSGICKNILNPDKHTFIP